MQSIYLKDKEGNFIEYIHQDDAARLFGIKPSSLSSYKTRGQETIKTVKIRNLVFCPKEQVDTLRKIKKLGIKYKKQTIVKDK